jgi:hypothetical protein
VATASESEAQFGHLYGKDPIEFDGEDWCGYDEDADETVGIYEFKSQFVTSKKK